MKAIPASLLPLCDAIDQLSEATWLEMEQGYRTRQPLDEESVTSYHLMRLAAAVPSIFLEKHSRRREARSGADWEIWVGRPGGYLGFRVQAKILKPTTSTAHYASLFSSKAKATTQLETLINNARVGRQTFPLICFYNSQLSSSEVASLGCPRLASQPMLAGWTVASAVAIRNRLKSNPSKRFRDLVPDMLPISCLFCCPRLRGGGDTRRPFAADLADTIQELWPDSRQDLRIQEVAPVYVERMFKGETVEHGWGRSFPKERALPSDIGRVVLLRDEAGAV